MGLFDKLKENAMNTVAKNAGRAANIAESRGYPDQSKIDEARQVTERAKHEAEMLRRKREEEERNKG